MKPYEKKHHLGFIPHPTDDFYKSKFEFGSFTTVVASISSSGEFTVEPGFRVDFRRPELRQALSEEDLAESLIVEYRDDRGNVLGKNKVMASSLCVIGESNPSRGRHFVSVLPFPESTSIISYYLNQRLVREIKKPSSAPNIEFLRYPKGNVLDEEVVAWKASCAKEADMRSILMFSHTDGKFWDAIVAPDSKENNQSRINLANLPGGKIRLRLMVTDGFTTISTECKPFSNAVKGIRPQILYPLEGSAVSPEAQIWFYGQAYDFEKQGLGQVELSWHSSIDGEIGHGQVIAVRLSPGRHDITLKCGEATTKTTIISKSDMSTADSNQNSEG